MHTCCHAPRQDFSGIEALNTLSERYQRNGKKIVGARLLGGPERVDAERGGSSVGMGGGSAMGADGSGGGVSGLDASS